MKRKKYTKKHDFELDGLKVDKTKRHKESNKKFDSRTHLWSN